MLDIPAVIIDGVLFVCIGHFMFSQSYLSGDEAAKYITPETKFWLNYAIGSLGSIAGSLKMYRSSSYAEHAREKKDKANGHTAFLTKTETLTKP
jgi:hypothetical protein